MSGTNSLVTGANWQGGGNNTYWYPLMAGVANNINRTETDVQTICSTGSTFTELTASLAAGSALTITLNFRIALANGNQVLTQATGAAAILTDATHSDVVAANALINVQYTNPAIQPIYTMNCQQNASTPFVLYGTGSRAFAGISFTTGTQFNSAIGSMGTSSGTSDNNSRQPIEIAGTASHFHITIDTAPTGTATIKFQINGAPGNQLISTTGTTGIVTDATHSDALVASNLLDVSYIATTAVGIFYTTGFSFAGTTSAHDIISSASGGGAVSNAFYATFSSYLNSLAAASINLTKTKISFACTASKLRANTATAGQTGTFVSTINGSTGNQIISYSSSTGVIVDATHSDAITAGTTVQSLASNGGAITIATLGMSLNDSSFPVAAPTFGAVFG